MVAVLTFQNTTPVPTVSPEPSNTPTESISAPMPTSSNTSQRTPSKTLTPSPTPDIPGLINQLNELKQQIAAYTPEPKPTPQVIIIQLTPTPSLIPSPTPTPLPPLKIAECRNDITRGMYEMRTGATQSFRMVYDKPINKNDYTWSTGWGNPAQAHGSFWITTFNFPGKHQVVLTDIYGQRDECWINILPLPTPTPTPSPTPKLYPDSIRFDVLPGNSLRIDTTPPNTTVSIKAITFEVIGSHSDVFLRMVQGNPTSWPYLNGFPITENPFKYVMPDGPIRITTSGGIQLMIRSGTSTTNLPYRILSVETANETRVEGLPVVVN